MGNVILNVVLFTTIGWALAGLMIIFGAVVCCTVIGIPLGVICFKKSKMLAFPSAEKLHQPVLFRPYT